MEKQYNIHYETFNEVNEHSSGSKMQGCFVVTTIISITGFITYLISSKINSPNDVCEDPLYEAVKNNNLEKISLLLSLGAANPDQVFPIINEAALHIAVRNNNKEIVQELLNWEAEVDIRTGNGHTPLHFAAQENNVEITKLLLNNYAHVMALDNFHQTALHFTAIGYPHNEDIKTKKIEIADELFKYKCDVNAKDIGGSTALHLTAEYNNPALFEYLIQHGAEMNIKDDLGRTACDIAYHENNNVVAICDKFNNISNLGEGFTIYNDV